MTQKGARTDFQRLLRAKGVEVVQFDFLTPSKVADYCYQRGFMQCLWECGGTLAAPAISSGTIHKVMSFVAPKIIGGTHAPTPVGNLGFVEMTQAVNLIDVAYNVLDGDLMITGALPSSGGLLDLHKRTITRESHVCAPKQTSVSVLLATGRGTDSNGSMSDAADTASSSGQADPVNPSFSSVLHTRCNAPKAMAQFYKAWDEWGCLSNFSPHPIDMPHRPFRTADAESTTAGSVEADTSPMCRWSSVEHYYQAQKFWGGGADSEQPSASTDIIDNILAAESPEEAARIGRLHQRRNPELVRADWDSAKVGVMLHALRKKFRTHAGPQAMLLSTLRSGGSGGESSALVGEPLELVEASPHDYFWGRGRDGSGTNMLGQLLMTVRAEMSHDVLQPGSLEGSSIRPSRQGSHV